MRRLPVEQHGCQEDLTVKPYRFLPNHAQFSSIIYRLSHRLASDSHGIVHLSGYYVRHRFPPNGTPFESPTNSLAYCRESLKFHPETSGFRRSR